MKANELMIGDLVEVISNDHLKYVQIAEIYQSSILTKESEFESEEVSIDNIKPIPLTSAIIEKNGSVHYEEYEEDFHDEYCVKHTRMRYKRYSNCIKQDLGGYGVCLDKDRIVSGLFHYVHELQHALKLCGIEKTIKL